MSIAAPPVGARVRHTMTYADGTVLAVEGIVMPYDDGLGFPNREPFVNISKELELSRFLVDRPEFTVALEVLEQPPCPPEPPNGAVYSNGIDVAIRCDDPADDVEGQSRWWRAGIETFSRWAGVVSIVSQPGWCLYIPDPADSAPALPWTTGEHKDRIGVTDNNLVWVNLRPDYHTPEEAEIRAAAILRAAREARQ